MNLKSVSRLVESREVFESLNLPDNVVRTLMKHEQLLIWAAREWEQRYPGQPFIPVFSVEECANNLARKRIVSGRKLRGKAHYTGYQMLRCPYIVPVNSFSTPSRTVVFSDAVGAFLFSFEDADGPFEVIYAAGHTQGSCGLTTIAVALVAPTHMDTWDDFETQCSRAVHRLERSEKVYIIGGQERTFQPTISWDEVILSETLKAELRSDIETFFDQGVDLYHQLNLPPFRKLLLVGPPGTGKSMLCAALARLALDRKYVVIYISSSQKRSDGEGNSFDKIQYALRIIANSQYPVVLIVEEIDVYLKPEDKSQILNVLDGFESPNNPRGALLIATTNYPEMIDERIAKRPGRIDRIITIPPIEDEIQATRMLRRYMGTAWQDEHSTIVGSLVGQTGAFVREVALYARMLALQKQQTEVGVDDLKQSIERLAIQLAMDNALRLQEVEA